MVIQQCKQTWLVKYSWLTIVYWEIGSSFVALNFCQVLTMYMCFASQAMPIVVCTCILLYILIYVC